MINNSAFYMQSNFLYFMDNGNIFYIDRLGRAKVLKIQDPTPTLTLVKDVNITSLYLGHKCPINYEI